MEDALQGTALKGIESSAQPLSWSQLLVPSSFPTRSALGFWEH